jgi:membrane fusion protein, copper/silver efflux system
MSDNKNQKTSELDHDHAPGAHSAGAGSPSHGQRPGSRWWMRLLLQPLILLATGVVVILLLGLTQRLGWIGSQGGGQAHSEESVGSSSYICPMMCTPPQSEPGRCPVCAMELVAATKSQDTGDQMSVEIEPAARRLANIQMAPVQSVSATRRIRAVGDLTYNETTLKSVAAYVEVRLEKLYADFTGLSFQKGDPLALVYSPQLYAAQVDFLLALASGTNDRHENLFLNNSRMGQKSSARQRLIEFGMTDQQIDRLQAEGRPSSRLTLYAPNNGTITEKLAVEGQYVSEGQPIYRLADLSTLWLMLQLFPEDAAAVRYGQRVEAEIQSMPSRKFSGRVAFVDPNVDPATRTVGVRVLIPNEEGLLRPGDLATANIDVPLMSNHGQSPGVYDPELAGQYISPRHPFIIRPTPGTCPECGLDLVPARQLGYLDQPVEGTNVLAIPRNAVLSAAGTGVVYVETEPGRFSLRSITLGPSVDDQIAVLDGLIEGEMVAVRGNFLIDSQMQLTGRPSLIDPMRAMHRQSTEPEGQSEQEALIILALAELSEEDRLAALAQEICPVAKMPLGSMGAPPKVDVDGTSYFICCEGCRRRLLDNPKKFLANLKSTPRSAAQGEDQ